MFSSGFFKLFSVGNTTLFPSIVRGIDSSEPKLTNIDPFSSVVHPANFKIPL